MFKILEVALDCIGPNPYQQRTVVNPKHVENLAISIASEGLQQPPQAREKPGSPGHYQLVFGHNRFAAYQKLRSEHPDNSVYTKMPLLLVTLDERQMFEGGVTENLQREDISPIAKARALKLYIEKFNASQRECGTLFGISQGAVSNLIRLLSLPNEVIDIADTRVLSERVTRRLVGLPDEVALKIARGAAKHDEDARPEYVNRCLREVKALTQSTSEARDRGCKNKSHNGQARSNGIDQPLLEPEACPCCYKTPKTYVRDGRQWRCGQCQSVVQLSVLMHQSS
ncbi:MAG: ParB/RepB/Spo0J family partition protein [Anaerolineae bacterium]|nr:ParB/RepB/Spo0J family partition protein [Anaerolineae bacterium]